MKIIDIRTKSITDEELYEKRPTRFHFNVQEVSKIEEKKLPSYEIEVAKKKGWSLKNFKKVTFSFTNHWGFKKRYRVSISFIISCLLLLILVGSAQGVGKSLALKDELLTKGKDVLAQASPESLFAASLTVKEANRQIAGLGQIPKTFSAKLQALDLGSAWAEFFLRTSGYYNPRHYLLLFQNNSEIRANGGFIGSYALLSVDQGNVEIQKLESIYNVSGQQRFAVIPPEPIQKVSTSWSLHDANWFFDFPTSVKALTWFYEKSGGATVDGVIAITPELLQTILEKIGPVDVPGFGVHVNAQNFMNVLQYEVEEKYVDRGLSDPKQILAELAPRILEGMMVIPKEELFSLAFDALERKEILLYFARSEEKGFISYYNWDGAIAHAQGDYLAIVNSNINGFKTDRMIKQSVSYETRILENYDIVNTVTIKRVHTGGDTPYEWYNNVNANFLRVYVPRGSQLLEAIGHTIEFNDPPLDYSKEEFYNYPLVERIQKNTIIDEKTGTRIFEENGKTVFGNWVYVSAKEHVEVKYTYKLPFKAMPVNGLVSLPLTVQKQPGVTYVFDYTVFTPPGWKREWQNPSEKTANPLLNKDTVYASVFSL